MPRIGMNPSRNRDTGFAPARVTAAVLTHVTNGEGYFEHRFEVLRLCIESLIATAGDDVDIMVFDNASSQQVVDYLNAMKSADRIQYLTLSSRNIGKMDALQMIFRSAPGEIIAYTDDDVLFLPGWLDAHLKILETFPKTGMVTGFYIRSQMAFSIKSTLEFANRFDVNAERGQLIEQKWEQHYLDNMGRTWERYREETLNLEDVRLTYEGVQALSSAGHHQFVAYKEVLLKALPEDWSGRLMGKMREFDDAVDKLGYLRLNTPQPVTRLLGNVLSEDNAAEAHQLGLIANAPTVTSRPSGFVQRIGRIPLVNGLARKLYNWLYKVINA
jgi:glycosyltransferase involved in cell wall biosynthesis